MYGKYISNPSLVAKFRRPNYVNRSYITDLLPSVEFDPTAPENVLAAILELERGLKVLNAPFNLSKTIQRGDMRTIMYTPYENYSYPFAVIGNLDSGDDQFGTLVLGGEGLRIIQQADPLTISQLFVSLSKPFLALADVYRVENIAPLHPLIAGIGDLWIEKCQDLYKPNPVE